MMPAQRVRERETGRLKKETESAFMPLYIPITSLDKILLFLSQNNNNMKWKQTQTKKWHKLPAGELQSIMQSDQENSHDFNMITRRIYFHFHVVFFSVVWLYLFFCWGIFKSDSCVSNQKTKQKEKRTVKLFCFFFFSYLATPDDHSETTSMASTGRQEQRGEKALVPHARTRSPK